MLKIPQCRCRGFTLVELLVVIAVIVILVAVLTPAYYKQPERQLLDRKLLEPVLGAADKALTKLGWQELAFVAPEKMELGATAVVELAVGGDKSFAELATLLEDAGKVKGQRVQVSDRMEAHLAGDGFHITATTPEAQIVSTREVTKWKWEVKANELGSRKLHLSLNALLVVDGKDASKSVQTFEREITVKVTSAAGAWAFIEHYWVYLAAVLGAIASLIGWWWKRNQKEGDPAKP